MTYFDTATHEVLQLARDLMGLARSTEDLATLAGILRAEGDDILLQLLDDNPAALAEIHYQDADRLAGRAVARVGD